MGTYDDFNEEVLRIVAENTAQMLRFRERFRNSKEKDPYSRIASWLFADKVTRPASPYDMDGPTRGKN